jgi:DNA-binding LacI/PurR family transcriptional regulator
MPTIKDVAREAGVSIATVSYVLNNKDQSIPDATRQQVLEAVERVGYAPNVNGRNLKASQSRLIGYAWHALPPGMVNPLLDSFTYYLAQAAEAVGYHLLTFTYPPDDPIKVYNELIQTGRVDGFVVASTEADDPRIAFLLERDFPFVAFGQSNPEWDFHWVDTDGRQGVSAAVRYLVELGHQRIGMIAWPEDSISGNFRIQGYRQALHETGLLFREDYLLHAENTEPAGRRAAAQWCALPPDERPTAIIAVSDLVAIGAMNEMVAQGMTPGREFSIVGFDDMPMSQYLRPALTTLRQPIPEISQEVIDLLESVLTRTAEREKSHRLFMPRLIIRDSSGPPLR